MVDASSKRLAFLATSLVVTVSLSCCFTASCHPRHQRLNDSPEGIWELREFAAMSNADSFERFMTIILGNEMGCIGVFKGGEEATANRYEITLSGDRISVGPFYSNNEQRIAVVGDIMTLLVTKADAPRDVGLTTVHHRITSDRECARRILNMCGDVGARTGLVVKVKDIARQLEPVELGSHRNR